MPWPAIKEVESVESQVRCNRTAEECKARWEALSRAPKPLDHERVARAREAFAQGRCEEPAAIIARLEQGGPLVQE